MNRTTIGATEACAGNDYPSADALKTALRREVAEQLSASATASSLDYLRPLCSIVGHLVLIEVAHEHGLLDFGRDEPTTDAGRGNFAALAYLHHPEVFEAARVRVLAGFPAAVYYASRPVDGEKLASDRAAERLCAIASFGLPVSQLSVERAREGDETVLRLMPTGEEFRFHHGLGRLTIHTLGPSIAEVYRVFFGRLFFHDATLFLARPGHGPADQPYCRCYRPGAGVRTLTRNEYDLELLRTDIDVLLDGTSLWKDRSFRAILRDESGELVSKPISDRAIGIWTRLMMQPNTALTADELVAPAHLAHAFKAFRTARAFIDSESEVEGVWQWTTVHRGATEGLNRCTFRPPPTLTYVLLLPCIDDP